MIEIDPIGIFHAHEREKATLPRQGCLDEIEGFIELVPGKNMEQALEDLESIDRIWIIFWMDRVTGWKTKIQTPRGVKKGVFATRSPHRPNPIGMTSVTLVKVQGRKVYVRGHDLLDKTPVLDIKPYLPYADSFPNANTGWIEERPSRFEVFFTSLAEAQMDFLCEKGLLDKKKVGLRLAHLHTNSKANRLKKIGENFFIVGCQEWRIFFSKEGSVITVLFMTTGYKNALPKSHQEFMGIFQSENQEVWRKYGDNF